MIKLQPGEHIVQTVRRHWFVILSETIFLVLSAFIPLIAFSFLFALDIILPTFPNVLLSIFATSAWWLMLWLGFFVFWTNYYLDAWIITNQKVIDIEQHNLFRREVSEYRLERIQDITIKINGLLATWLKFGDVDIQTAGESSEHYIIRQAPNPEMVKILIMELQHKVVTAIPTVNAVMVNNQTDNTTV